MSSNPKPSILVLGLGNPIRHDDAIGLCVVEKAQKQFSPPEDVSVTFEQLCAGGFDLLYEVLGHDELIVVDAFFSDESVPGRVRTLDRTDLQDPSHSPKNLPHLLSLPKALEWGEQVGYAAPKLRKIIAIDVTDSCMEFGEGLSAQVKNSIHEATDQVLEILSESIRDMKKRKKSERRSDQPQEGS